MGLSVYKKPGRAEGGQRDTSGDSRRCSRRAAKGNIILQVGGRGWPPALSIPYKLRFTFCLHVLHSSRTTMRVANMFVLIISEILKILMQKRLLRKYRAHF